jgi:hypothetical protein
MKRKRKRKEKERKERLPFRFAERRREGGRDGRGESVRASES